MIHLATCHCNVKKPTLRGKPVPDHVGPTDKCDRGVVEVPGLSYFSLPAHIAEISAGKTMFKCALIHKGWKFSFVFCCICCCK